MGRYLLDTNVVLRLIDREAEEHESCRTAVEKIHECGGELLLAPQVIYEFWVVSTRPADGREGQRKGFGWTVEKAKEAVDHLVNAFRLYPDTKDVFDTWRRLVDEHKVQGKRAHDVRLVAYQKAYGIDSILTLNARDFRGLGVTVLTPADVGGAL